MGVCTSVPRLSGVIHYCSVSEKSTAAEQRRTIKQAHLCSSTRTPQDEEHDDKYCVYCLVKQ